MKIKQLIFILFCCGMAATSSAQLQLTLSKVEQTCYNSANGSATVTVTGGVPPYQYLWKSVSSQLPADSTSATITKLFYGDFTVKVTDSKGTTAKGTIILGPSNFGFTSSKTPSDCGKSNGTATVTGISAHPPYSYLWENGATTSTLTGMAGGKFYACTITDAKGCVYPYAGEFISNNIKGTLTVSNSGQCKDGDAAITMSGLTGGVPPYSFTWSNGEITQNLSNLSSGAYYVSILDSKGCSIDWQAGWNYIEARTSRPDIKYASSTAGSCQFNPSGEIGVYLYWEGGSNPPFTTTALNLTTNTTYNHTFPVDTTRQGVVPLQETGLYQIILKGTSGCADTTTVYFDKLAKSISTTSKVCGNNALIFATGGTPPYSYDWTYYDPINSWWITVGTSSKLENAPKGLYNCRIWDKNNCSTLITISITDTICKEVIKPIVFCDENKNCKYDPNEPLLDNFILKTYPDDYFLMSNIYNPFLTLDTGTVGIKLNLPNNYWVACQDSISFSSNGQDTAIVFFPLQKTVLCPKLEIDISTNRLRPCLTSNYDVVVCNKGTLATNSVSYVDVNFDNWLGFESCALVSQPINATTRRFFIDKQLAMGECFSFSIVVKTSCDATVGWTQCVKAHVYPDSICAAPAAWSGARIELETECVGDSVCFKIKNTGTAPTSLNKNLKYQIVEDNIILKQGIFNLNPNQIQNIKLPATGKTYRLFADQEPNYPVLSLPTVALEGCKSNVTQPVSLGFVTQFPNGDAEPFISEHCQVIVNSFDPNDKQGFPTGVNNERFIEPNQDIEYQIRFQNTGTAEAIDVILRDELSSLLDIQNLRMGASSHPYTWEVNGKGVLTVKFKNINLPAKIIDEAKSNGFVKFRIPQVRNLANFTQINNQAGIYFDNNAPVITNTTLHTVCKNCLQFLPTRDLVTDILVKIYPNPFQDNTTIELIDAPLGNYQFELYDILGRQIMIQNIDNQRFNFERNNLETGIYFYKITDGKKTVGKGKMIAQ